MLAFGNETVLERSKAKGVRRHRWWKIQKRGCHELLCVRPNHQALARKARETGDVEPKPIRGRPGVKGAALEEWLPSYLEKNHDLTHKERREAFEDAHSRVRVSTASVGRAIARLPGGWPLKKSKVASERDDEARGLWRWLASHFDARCLVFVDESVLGTPP